MKIVPSKIVREAWRTIWQSKLFIVASLFGMRIIQMFVSKTIESGSYDFFKILPSFQSIFNYMKMSFPGNSLFVSFAAIALSFFCAFIAFYYYALATLYFWYRYTQKSIGFSDIVNKCNKRLVAILQLTVASIILPVVSSSLGRAYGHFVLDNNLDPDAMKIVLIIALITLALIIYSLLSLVLPIMLLENANIMAAIRQSYHSSKKQLFVIMASFILFGIATLAPMASVMGLASILRFKSLLFFFWIVSCVWGLIGVCFGPFVLIAIFYRYLKR